LTGKKAVPEGTAFLRWARLDEQPDNDFLAADCSLVRDPEARKRL
jgi:hemolysin-activating ACP:hemolysin acyltransferase